MQRLVSVTKRPPLKGGRKKLGQAEKHGPVSTSDTGRNFGEPYTQAAPIDQVDRRGLEEHSVTYTIAEPCVDIKDKACIEECPVDCIYEGARMLYIHRTSAATAAPASRSSPSRPSTTKMTCPINGADTPRSTPTSLPNSDRPVAPRRWG